MLLLSVRFRVMKTYRKNHHGTRSPFIETEALVLSLCKIKKKRLFCTYIQLPRHLSLVWLTSGSKERIRHFPRLHWGTPRRSLFVLEKGVRFLITLSWMILPSTLGCVRIIRTWTTCSRIASITITTPLIHPTEKARVSTVTDTIVA